jgi:hypothetical protein
MKPEQVVIAENVFGFETEVSLGLSMALPLRMTVLRDQQGLTLISPIKLDQDLRDRLSALGEVHTVIAPNRLHTKFIEGAQRAFPQAKLIAAPGVKEKCPGLRVDQGISSCELSDDLEARFIEGADRLSEAVLFHRPSQSLVVTDLIFNVRSANFMTRCLLKGLSRAYGKPAQSRLLRPMVHDRVAAARSIESILHLPLLRIIVAHGELIDERAQDALHGGLKWMRGEF